MSNQDAIGVVRKHRWASLDVQRQQLQADGCRVIVDLDNTPRDWMYTAIREGTVIKVPFAFLLCQRKGAVAGLADYRAFACKIANLPRGCFGAVKDMETGLVASTPGTRKAMLDVVRRQLAQHGKGLRSPENGKRGRVALKLTELQDAKGQAIWFNLKRYRKREDAEAALREKVHKDLTHWAANRFWGPRQFGAKATER